MTETILLVDDDAAFRDVYRELLIGEGYSVAEAGKAPEALTQLAKTGARLIVLDLMLPPPGARRRALLSPRRSWRSGPRPR